MTDRRATERDGPADHDALVEDALAPCQLSPSPVLLCLLSAAAFLTPLSWLMLGPLLVVLAHAFQTSVAMVGQLVAVTAITWGITMFITRSANDPLRFAGEHRMLIYQPPATPTSIPLVNLRASFSDSPQAIDAVARQIHRACREMGFFYVSHHGIDQQVIDRAFKWSARFFDLPAGAKQALNMTQSPGAVGYESGVQQLDSQTAGAEKAPPDLKESYQFGMEMPPDHPWARKRLRTYGHNQWPASLPGFREAMLQYQGAVTQLARHLLRLIARSLDLPIDWFAGSFAMGSGSIRLLKYPPQPVTAAFNQIGAGAHTDWGALTVLAQDTIGGLEVRNADGDWIEATPVPDTFVINLGDLMARWTNGIYNANMHRVKNHSRNRARYSIVSFNSPRPDVVIEPMPGCVSEEFPRQFPTCTAQEHVSEMFRRSYGYSPGQAVS